MRASLVLLASALTVVSADFCGNFSDHNDGINTLCDVQQRNPHSQAEADKEIISIFQCTCDQYDAIFRATFPQCFQGEYLATKLAEFKACDNKDVKAFTDSDVAPITIDDGLGGEWYFGKHLDANGKQIGDAPVVVVTPTVTPIINSTPVVVIETPTHTDVPVVIETPTNSVTPTVSATASASAAVPPVSPISTTVAGPNYRTVVPPPTYSTQVVVVGPKSTPCTTVSTKTHAAGSTDVPIISGARAVKASSGLVAVVAAAAALF
ncbi:hypothetical protein HKX48_009435 [Thoreauomyces humboldtii]|nr:hypothetical protein HKX48_009435 [Thoreauomyces humboldtii]